MPASTPRRNQCPTQCRNCARGRLTSTYRRAATHCPDRILRWPRCRCDSEHHDCASVEIRFAFDRCSSPSLRFLLSTTTSTTCCCVYCVRASVVDTIFSTRPRVADMSMMMSRVFMFAAILCACTTEPVRPTIQISHGRTAQLFLAD